MDESLWTPENQFGCRLCLSQTPNPGKHLVLLVQMPCEAHSICNCPWSQPHQTVLNSITGLGVVVVVE